ncbi:putative quinol monooxygenase [Croceicoccus sp. BE223]|uniref:putative quinol monooxygenase n=1 Tax=Croceicoccus sp. BE223 TaxID=2817716 RepID=UPI002864BE9F|nr:putative quinol monooxygenase [Croceicoccus sp. BE223]MDR7102465.1 quinol monooxygenase YgiN [Croceicoccus sp. BE223]
MILVEGSFRLPPERLAEAEAPIALVVAASRAEAGCIEYAYGADASDPGLFIVLEKWDSRAALDAHFASAHMKRWQETRAALGFHARAIRVHETGGGETI